MKFTVYKDISLQLMPILGGILLSYFFWRNNLLLAFLYILAIVIILLIKKYPADIHALVIGLIAGLVVEIPGTLISGYQTFTNPNLLGIPILLPIAWAYGFMMMKRIGVILYRANVRGYL